MTDSNVAWYGDGAIGCGQRQAKCLPMCLMIGDYIIMLCLP